MREANIYQEDLDSFLVVAVLNFNGLNSTLPRSADFVITGWEGQGLHFAGRGRARIPELKTGIGPIYFFLLPF